MFFIKDVKPVVDSLRVCTMNFENELNAKILEMLEVFELMEREVNEFFLNNKQFEMENSEFSKLNDRLLEECMFKDIMCIILCSFKDIDDYTDMACQFLEKTKERERLKIELSKQNERVGNELDNELSKRFARLEEHSISLELALQHNKEFFLKTLGKSRTNLGNNKMIP
ncbi:hypothetical protein Tco_0040010 [Tanacetum coccineum]